MGDEFYTYELVYPESMGGTVFYVGQGQGDRIDGHEWEAQHGVQSPKCDVIRSIWENGEQIIKRKVAEHLSREKSLLIEVVLVQRYGLENLTNKAPGGRNRKGMAIYTDEWRKHRSKLAREAWQHLK